MNKKTNLFFYAIIFLFSGILYSSGEKALPDALREFIQGKKRMRVAVMDFANTDGTRNRFDVFIADSILSELSKYPITLLERKRLELLLGERELSQTGVIDSEKAIKLGTLLPVDVIISGSYTIFADKIVINGRFIDVSSGEILHAFTAYMKNDGSGSAGKETDKCESDTEEVNKSLIDLRTEPAVNNAVKAALKIPFSGECGKIHYKVMSTFARYKKFPEKYKSFLIDTLNAIDDPSDDARTNEILRYFASDNAVDPDEWKAGIIALKKMRNRALHIPLGNMLNNEHENPATLIKRSDEIMKLGIDGKIGRPVAIPAEDILISLLAALKRHRKQGDAEASVYIFKKYMDLIPDNDTYNKRASGYIEGMFFDETEKKIRKDILDALTGFYKRDSALLAEELADFIKRVNLHTEDRYEKEEIKRTLFAEDAKILNKSLEEEYCASLNSAIKNNYPYIIEERTIYILTNQMKCEFAPDIRDLENDMRSKDWDRKIRAIDLLSKIGEAAAEAEKTVILYLGQQGFDTRGQRLRRLCAKTLGNIRTQNPEAIRLLIESFPDYEGASHEAEEAIDKIGPVAIPYLIDGLEHRHHAARLRCAKALGNHGAKAKKALPALEKLAKDDENPYVRKQAEGAIQMIKNDF